ncbi:hypothetical protein KI387_032308, partial [Taxus chinensis]
ECCEVEMEDLVDLIPISDIDEDDAENPLVVTEYVQHIYIMYRGREVHLKFELTDEMLFLTVNIIYRYLSRNRVMSKHLQLVGVIAMRLAYKYEEVYVPVVDDFIQISDKAYSREEMFEM